MFETGSALVAAAIGIAFVFENGHVRRVKSHGTWPQDNTDKGLAHGLQSRRNHSLGAVLSRAGEIVTDEPRTKKKRICELRLANKAKSVAPAHAGANLARWTQ